MNQIMNPEKKIKYPLSIGDVARHLSLTADTLRYYEKCGLLPPVAKNESGHRCYYQTDISTLKFIIRAKKMNFSLSEIQQLLQMRQEPRKVKDEIRLLTAQKLSQIEKHIEELSHLKKELHLLLNLCKSSKGGCPIIAQLDSE